MHLLLFLFQNTKSMTLFLKILPRPLESWLQTHVLRGRKCDWKRWGEEADRARRVAAHPRQTHQPRNSALPQDASNQAGPVLCVTGRTLPLVTAFMGIVAISRLWLLTAIGGERRILHQWLAQS